MRGKTAVLLLSAVLSSSALAEVYRLEEIVTTATREEEKITDIPVRVDAVPQDEIQLDRPNHIKEDLNSLPGVLVTQVAASLGHATAIRLPINYGPYYLFLQDGIPVQSSGFFNHNGLWWTSWESSPGAFEVLKGVGTALYGSDAIGAVINVKSEEPTGKLERKLEIEGGQWGYFRFRGGISDMPDEKNAYLARFSYSQTDGWRDKTRYKRGEILLKHYYYLNDGSSFETSLLANKMDAQMAGYLDYQTFKTNPEDSGLPDDLTDPYRKVDMIRLATKYKNELSKESKIQIIPYVRFNRNRYVATWIPKVYPERDTKTYTAGMLNQYIWKHSMGKTIFGLDIELTKAKSHYWQSRPTQTIWGKTYPQGDIYKYDVDFVNLAPYIHNNFRFGRLDLTLGLRADYARYEYDNKLSDGEFGVWYRPADRSDEFKHLSPKAGLLYSINKNNSVFFRYAHGFRIPQASRLYELKADYREVSLNPEKADSFEVGYTGKINSFLLTVSGYYMEIRDKIVTVDVGGLRYNTNAGKTRHKGVELGGTWIVSKELKIRGSYSYSKHEYVRFNTGDTDYSGNEMSMAPRDLSNVRVIYTPSFQDNITLEFEYQHVGSYYMDDANTQKYGGYDIYNVRGEMRLNKNIKLFAKVWNITDKIYAETANIAYGKERYRPGMPRTVYAGVDIVW
ncbi:TonB-dependent receptor [Persephonella sp.]